MNVQYFQGNSASWIQDNIQTWLKRKEGEGIDITIKFTDYGVAVNKKPVGTGFKEHHYMWVWYNEKDEEKREKIKEILK